MKVWFGQIYIEAGASFSFSHHMQRYLSDTITALVVPSPTFINEYGEEFELMFNISAKTAIPDNEIKGPTVFRKSRDVEYTIFLPFHASIRNLDIHRSALRFLLKGVCSVFHSLGIDTTRIVDQQDVLIDCICSDPKMFK